MRLSKYAAVFLMASVLWGCTQNGGDVKKIIATDVMKPTIPAALSVSGTTSSTVNLTWTESSDNVGVAGYRVYRNGGLVATATGTSFTDTGLSPMTNYCYQIAAVDAGENESEKGSGACGTTLAAAKSPWPKAFGGSGDEYSQGLKTDSSDNAYILGIFNETVDFDPGDGTDIIKASVPNQKFVTKFNADGSYAWTHTWESNADAIGNSRISVDLSGSIYIVGSFQQTTNFNPKGIPDTKTPSGGNDIYITKIKKDGTYLWTKTISGPGNEFIRSIHIGSDNSLYMSGVFYGTGNVDFDISQGEDLKPANGNSRGFITKINPGESYAWTKIIEAPSSVINYTATDKNGNIYYEGTYNSNDVYVDLDPDSGQDLKPPSTTGGFDNYKHNTFITKLNTDGSYAWSKVFPLHYLKYLNQDNVMWVSNTFALDSEGNSYITGAFTGTADLDPGDGTDLRTTSGVADQFVAKINNDGSYAWARTFTVPTEDSQTALGTILLYNGKIILDRTIIMGSTDLDPGPGTDIQSNLVCSITLTTEGVYSGFKKPLASYSGQEWHYLAYNSSGKALIAGFFTGSLDFDPSTEADNRISNGGPDIYLMQIDDPFADNSKTLSDKLSAFHYYDVYVDSTTIYALASQPIANGTIHTNKDGTQFKQSDMYVLKIDASGNLETSAFDSLHMAGSSPGTGTLVIENGEIKAFTNYATDRTNGTYLMDGKTYVFDASSLALRSSSILFSSQNPEYTNWGWYPRIVPNGIEHFSYAGYFRYLNTTQIDGVDPPVMQQEYNSYRAAHSGNIISAIEQDNTDAKIVQNIINRIYGNP